jgi:phosphoglycolate phosphatase
MDGTDLGYEGVVFDLDGTLIDSVPDLTDAVNRLLAAAGKGPLPEDEVKLMVGDGVATLVARAFAAAGGAPDGDIAPHVARFIADYEKNAAIRTRPWPNVMETLERLRQSGVRLAVCTNKVRSATVNILDALDMAQAFDAVVGCDDTPAPKPDPRHVLVTLERLGVSPERAVYVGDSPNDVVAAKAAGVACIVVSFGYTRTPAAELGADRVIDDFTDLADAMRALASGRAAG